MSCRLASRFLITGTLSRAMSAIKEKVRTWRAIEAGFGTAAATDETVREEKKRLKKASSRHRNAGT